MNDQLLMRLRRVHLPARGLFYEIYSMMQHGKPYGTLDMELDQLADTICGNRKTVQVAMGELKRKGVIQIEGGVFRCPLMADERKNHELREEIKHLAWKLRRSPKLRAV